MEKRGALYYALYMVNLSSIGPGKNVPNEINVFIEIPQGGTPVKYELDKDSGVLFVDRFLHTAMSYPGNYGFIPCTLSDDGDPCDVIIVGHAAVVPGCVVRARPIGALMMKDNKGTDEKILAVPVNELHPYYGEVASYRDLPPILCSQIEHFFSHYKDLEKGKWVRIDGWVDTEKAQQLINDAVTRYRG